MTIWRDFTSLIYPRYCLACDGGLAKGEDTLCSYCLLELPRTNFHLEPDNPLYQRLMMRIRIDHAFSFIYFSRKGIAQKMLHRLKYENAPEIGVMLGKIYGEELRIAGFTTDVVVPVPLHISKQRVRGYNQSEKFAEGLASVLNVPVDTSSLIRLVKTETQTRKNKLNRWENVREVFALKETGAITGKSVLLTDDVATTGSTLEACAIHLLEAGCKVSIGCIAFAR